ncbi:unnamed protein product, partial [marine sediment metagenome]
GLGSIGLSGDEAMIAMEDTAYLLQGVLEYTKSGEYPVVAVDGIPTSGTVETINDRTRFCYGRMLGPIAITVECGTLGVDERLRVDPVTIEPIA